MSASPRTNDTGPLAPIVPSNGPVLRVGVAEYRTLCATNVALAPRAPRQLGKQVHTSMARAIQPFHTLYDGDAFFAATTEEVPLPPSSEIALGVLAAELAWDAILSAVQPPA
jgi:hypothetical protein